MMQAIDVETGVMVAGDEARRDGRYLCPECKTVVGLRAGLRRSRTSRISRQRAVRSPNRKARGIDR